MKQLLDIVTLGGAMIGSGIIAFNLGINQIGYVFFLASSIASWFLLKQSNASKSLVLTTLWFMVMNVIGMVRY
jgi:hypothetical protein